MAKVRTKVDVKPIVNDIGLTKVRLADKIVETKIEDKKTISDNRFERHKAFGDLIKRNEIGEKVKQGLLKWSFYALDNDNPYQYYYKIKK
jgi:hypothetical protein